MILVLIALVGLVGGFLLVTSVGWTTATVAELGLVIVGVVFTEEE